MLSQDKNKMKHYGQTMYRGPRMWSKQYIKYKIW